MTRFDEVLALARGPAPPGERRPGGRPALERVTDALVGELRRRLGGPFTTQELAELYVSRAPTGALTWRCGPRPATPPRGI